MRAAAGAGPAARGMRPGVTPCLQPPRSGWEQGDEAGAGWARASSRQGRAGGRAWAADLRTWLRALA